MDKNRRSFLQFLGGFLGLSLFFGRNAEALNSHFRPLSDGKPVGRHQILAGLYYNTCKSFQGPCDDDKQGLICKDYIGPCRKEVACRDHSPMKCSSREYSPPCLDFEQCPGFANTRTNS